MTEEQFWKCSPKKLHALVKVYQIQKAGSQDEEEQGGATGVKHGFVDQLF